MFYLSIIEKFQEFPKATETQLNEIVTVKTNTCVPTNPNAELLQG